MKHVYSVRKNLTWSFFVLVLLRWGMMKNIRLLCDWEPGSDFGLEQQRKPCGAGNPSATVSVLLFFFFFSHFRLLFLSLCVFLVTCSAGKLGVHLLGSIISVMPLDSLLTTAFYGWVSVAPLLLWPCRLKWSLSLSNNQLPSFLSLSRPMFLSLSLCLSLHPFSPFPTPALLSLGTLFGRVAMSDIFPLLPSAIETGSLAVCLFPQLADLKMLHATHLYTHSHIHSWSVSIETPHISYAFVSVSTTVTIAL